MWNPIESDDDARTKSIEIDLLASEKQWVYTHRSPYHPKGIASVHVGAPESEPIRGASPPQL
jgi:hypothetical protein